MYLDCVFNKDDDSIRFNAFPAEVKSFLEDRKHAEFCYYVVKGSNLATYTVKEYLNLKGTE